jgi:hypothetical protein
MSNTIFTSRFPKWAAVITILSAWVFMLLYSSNAHHKLQCKLTNLNTELTVKSPTRSAAVICATQSSSDTLVDVVPQLLSLLGDESETAKAERPGWLTKREYTKGTVGSFARDALKKATPKVQNVKPMVAALIDHANRVPLKNLKSDRWPGLATNGAEPILALLQNKYTNAGFSPQIVSQLEAHADEIINDEFSAIVRITLQQNAPLARDKLLAAEALIAKFAAEDRAEMEGKVIKSAQPELSASTEKATGQAERAALIGRDAAIAAARAASEAARAAATGKTE